MENIQYRMLKVGEIIQEGDEYFNLGAWVNVQFGVGDKVPLLGKIRRPVKQGE